MARPIEAMKLTDTNVARLKPAARGASYLVRDDELSGFHVRVSHKHKVYKLALDVRINGERKTCGWSWKGNQFSAKAARAAAMKIISERDVGTLSTDKPEKVEPKAITFAEAWRAYREASRDLSASSIEIYADIVQRYLLKRWPETPLRDITRADVKAFHQEITDDGKPYQANGVARLGNAIYKFARSELEAPGLSDLNPFRAYKMANKERPRKWGIGLKSLPAWWANVQAVAPPIYREINLFIMLTATRRENAEALKWEQVNFEERVIVWPAPKGGEDKAFRMPMSQAVIDCLQRARSAGQMIDEERAAAWVFPSKRSHVGHLVEPKTRGILKSAHALRASWITIATDLGIEREHRQMITNHALPNNVHDNYANPQEWTKLAESMERVSSEIMKAIAQ